MKSTRVPTYLFTSILALILAYATILPPNAGPDEMHHARSSWYLFENPDKIFSDSNYITYQFPVQLGIDQVSVGDTGVVCTPQSQNALAHCWQSSSKKSEKAEITSMILYYSPIYYYWVGAFQHSGIFENPIYAGRFASMALNLVLVFLSILLLSRVVPSGYLLSLYWILTPAVMFLFAVINPSGFEVSSALLTVSSLIYLEKSEIQRKRTFAAIILIFFPQLMLVLSRPIGFVWLILIVFFFYLTLPRRILFTSIVPVLVGFAFNIALNNRSWRLNPESEFVPDSLFYFDETVRVVLNSGNWILSIFGNLGWTEITMPLILVFANLVIFSIVVSRYSIFNRIFVTRILIWFLGMFLVPMALSIPYSANWPTWWSGRYNLSIFIAFSLLVLTSVYHGHRLMTWLGILNQLTLLTLSFWRYNWGLYSTNTPVIANGQQIPNTNLQTFAFFSLLWLFSTLVAVKRNGASANQARS